MILQDMDETTLGGVLLLNDDDDVGGTSGGGNSIQDFADGTSSQEDDDLLPVRIELTPPNLIGTGALKLIATEGRERVRIWGDRRKNLDAQPTFRPNDGWGTAELTWDMPMVPLAFSPTLTFTVFVEGVQRSQQPLDVELLLGYSPNETNPTGFQRQNDARLSVIRFEPIRQSDNSPFPTVGDDAAHMVSTEVTTESLPDPAATTFAGIAGPQSDQDTFRFQVTALPATLTPTVRVEVVGGTYSEDFDFATNGEIEGVSTLRTNEYLRLVSDDVDDDHAGRQTVRVDLEGAIRSTLLIGSRASFTRQLLVGRPASEDGPKAIRTADFNVIRVGTVLANSDDMRTSIDDEWAQLAIRFNLLGDSAVPIVQNGLLLEGVAEADGFLVVTIVDTEVRTPVSAGDSSRTMAEKLTARILSATGLGASTHT
jgi:hypothetical protein